MAEKKKDWREVVVPFEMFQSGTRGGAVVFKIQDGDYKWYHFVRPLALVRRSRENPNGFALHYSVEQELDSNGDILGEVPETISLRKTKKNEDGKYVTDDEVELTMDNLENII